jgi:predicted enzyme related to lactoylglutathione lyase
MPIEFDLVTIDVADDVAMAAFWASTLNLEEIESEDGGRWRVFGLRHADGSTTRRLGLQRIPNLGAAIQSWEGPSKSRQHLDLKCTPAEFNAEVDRVVALGATELRPRRTEYYGSIATLADPEGNLFDICAYE